MGPKIVVKLCVAAVLISAGLVLKNKALKEQGTNIMK